MARNEEESGVDPQFDPDPGFDFSKLLTGSALSTITLPSIMEKEDFPALIFDEVSRRVDSADIPFDANLAEYMDETTLDSLSSDLLQSVDADYEVNAPWREAMRNGMALMGVTKMSKMGPFTHSSQAVHPMVAEAALRFWARTMPELVPIEGPCKGKVVGFETEDKMASAELVADYLNYQIIHEDLGYRENMDQTIFQMPLRGSSIKKGGYDDEYDTVRSWHVPSDEMIFSYGMTSFQTSERYTHRQAMSSTTIARKQANGVYRDIDIGDPSEIQDEYLELQKEKDESQGVESNEESNIKHIVEEIYVMLELPGFPDIDVETGIESNLPLPYIVSIDRASTKVLSIYRDWSEDDPMKHRIRRFTRYQYFPGFGFYGMGLFTLLGSIAENSTELMRIITNGGAFASVPGGFKPKDGAKDTGNMSIEPGVYKAVEGTYEELTKSFYTPTIKGPEPILLDMLKLNEQIAQRITSTQDVMVGQADNKAPVGTTIALLEKAMEVDNAIQVGLFLSMQEELEIRYEFTARFMPAEGRAFLADGKEEQFIDPFTFDPTMVMVAPTVDPSQASATRRIASAQLGYEMAREHPDLIDLKEAIMRVFKAAKIPDYEAMFTQAKQAQPLDPVSEGFMLLTGEPIDVFEDQDHQSHIAVHTAFMQNPEYGGNPVVAEALGPQIQAHIAKHMAYLYMHSARQLGVAVVPPQIGEQGAQSPLTPEQQTIAAMQAAQAAQALMQIPGLPGQPTVDPAAEQEQKMRFKDEEHQQRMRHKDEDHTQKLMQTASADDLNRTKEREKFLDQLSRQDIERDIQKAKGISNVIDMRAPRSSSIG